MVASRGEIIIWSVKRSNDDGEQSPLGLRECKHNTVGDSESITKKRNAANLTGCQPLGYAI